MNQKKSAIIFFDVLLKSLGRQTKKRLGSVRATLTGMGRNGTVEDKCDATTGCALLYVRARAKDKRQLNSAVLLWISAQLST